MVALLSILIFFGLVLFVSTYLSRRDKTEDEPVVLRKDMECCGAHEVCGRDSLLIRDTKVEYFDDEELDAMAGIAPEKLTKAQIAIISEVFYTMRENDVAPWLRSLQLRNIQLPDFIREEAQMIVAERLG